MIRPIHGAAQNRAIPALGCVSVMTSRTVIVRGVRDDIEKECQQERSDDSGHLSPKREACWFKHSHERNVASLDAERYPTFVNIAGSPRIPK
jgi:hypothetical protein